MPSGTVYVKGGTAFSMNGNTKVTTMPQTLTIQKQQVDGYETFDSQVVLHPSQRYCKDVVDNKLYGNHDLIP